MTFINPDKSRVRTKVKSFCILFDISLPQSILPQSLQRPRDYCQAGQGGISSVWSSFLANMFLAKLALILWLQENEPLDFGVVVLNLVLCFWPNKTFLMLETGPQMVQI